MHHLFTEASAHAGLARTVEQIGQPRFWRQLILLLQQWLAFDNALAMFYPRTGLPRALEIFDARGEGNPEAMALYLSGLYQLDPFYQACQERIGDGLHRLEEVAPDQFRQSEYYLKYFHDHVLEDEVQFIVQLGDSGALSLSLGRRERFDSASHGLLALVCPWVVALMTQHWQQHSLRPAPAAGMAHQVRDAMSLFGAKVLSERELEIARLILRGYSSKAMAERLAISPETIKVHRRHLYAKLDISSQPELFSLFLQSLGHDPQDP
ncbi:LuxR C-terminal-related transcriptional regulator [Pseudomonas sp. B21-023]|uniref:helix-turn-helix transcriptional regulator n=1 Tax=unclassified Pseudomonas TaxID=196821 RepID=UPI00111A463E|nr:MULTISPECIES: helix-turn-helix transcriptional regulator [unclassified Pseudomonas]MBI6952156.1 helix-turn-helix transcriptional regulator [Pseudomonas sp. CCOS 191]UVL21376.1 LuxR C-terminal-related transcriptional regulator [Pseudomonas sp. B21-044]UVM18780.1 LuxR C-terminal-related transcriptional regulator [Pseudomonas sp. B21-023]